jgi:tape measure domain-containing protein
MAGGVFVGSVYATMRLDTGGFVSDISKAKTSLNSMAGQFDGGAKSAQGFTGAVFKGTFAADALMRGITAVGGAAKDAFGELITLQNARQSFEVLTGSASNASKVMADLAAYAKQTPFEFNQIAGATKTLLGFGSTTETVGGQIRQIGDIAGATGGDIGNIALVFGQVQAQGKLMGQDFLQLINNGVAVGDMLANELGVPASEVKKKIEEGAVTFDVFSAAIGKATSEGGKFYGGADKLSQTLSGRISTLKDNFTAMVGTFVGVDFSTGVVQAGGAFDRLSQAAKGVNDWISANEATINKVASVIGGAFLSAIDAAVAAIGGVVTGIQWWVQGFQQGNPLIILATGLIGGLVATFVAWQIAMTAVRIATTAWTAAQWLLNAALTANPIGIIIGLVVGLIAGIVLLYQNSETFRNIVTGAFTAVGNAVMFVWNWIKNNWPLILAILTGPIGIAVLLIVKNWNTIKQAFANAWNFIKSVWSGVTGFFGGIGNGIRNIFENAVQGAKNIFNNLVSFVRGIPGSILKALGNAGQMLFNFGKDMLNGLVNGAKSILSNIGNFFLDAVPGWIKEPFKKALGINSPSKVFMGYGQNIGEAVPMGVSKQMGAIKQSMYDMAGVVTSSFNPEVGAGLASFNGIRSGSATMAGGASSSVQMYGNINLSSDVDADRFLTNAGLMREGQLVEKGMAI